MMDEEFDGDDLDEEIELDEEDLDDDLVAVDDDSDDIDAVVEGDEESSDDTSRAIARPAGEDYDEDEELITPDDVEADLDTILKDRMVAAEEVPAEEEEDEEVDDRSDNADRLQPKRPDEQLCSSCFLLVRESAPQCPVGDDDCPLFSKR